MTDLIRPIVRRPSLHSTPPVQPAPRFRLDINGIHGSIHGGFTGSEAGRQAALRRETLRLLRDGWQVRSLTPGFAQLWRLAPAEMRELRVVEVKS